MSIYIICFSLVFLGDIGMPNHFSWILQPTYKTNEGTSDEVAFLKRGLCLLQADGAGVEDEAEPQTVRD